MALALSVCTVGTEGKADFIQYTESAGQIYNICPELLQAMIFYESSWQPTATNGNCTGLMQVNPNCHSDRMERISKAYNLECDLYNPQFCIMVGADYLAELIDEYGDVSLALDLYNGNSKAFSNYKQGVLSKYSNKILTLSEELERKNGK